MVPNATRRGFGLSVTCTSCAELPRGEYTGDLPSALVLEVGSLVITLGLVLVLKEKSVGWCLCRGCSMVSAGLLQADPMQSMQNCIPDGQ